MMQATQWQSLAPQSTQPERLVCPDCSRDIPDGKALCQPCLKRSKQRRQVDEDAPVMGVGTGRRCWHADLNQRIYTADRYGRRGMQSVWCKICGGFVAYRETH